VGAAVVAVVGAASVGLSGLGGPGSYDAGVGAFPVPSSGPSGFGTASGVPGPSMYPVPGPSLSSAPMPSLTARPTSAAGYCPQHLEDGRIAWPKAINDLQTEEPAWGGPASGPFLPYTATRAIICRYDDDNKLAGAADIREKAVVRRLQAPVNAATTVRTEDTCDIDGTARVFFLNRDHGKNVWVDLTTCDAWWMPYSISITGGFVDQVRSLTPDGSGRKR
jgi:hypothetical protein